MKSYFFISALLLSLVSVSHARSLEEIAVEKAEKKRDYLSELQVNIEKDAKLALRNLDEKKNIEKATTCDLSDAEEVQVSSQEPKKFDAKYSSEMYSFIAAVAFDQAKDKAYRAGYSYCDTRYMASVRNAIIGKGYVAYAEATCYKTNYSLKRLSEDERVVATCGKIKKCSQKILKAEKTAETETISNILVTADADYKCDSL